MARAGQSVSESASQRVSQSTGPAHAFDYAARDYDRTFTDTRLGRWLREAVWERLEADFGPGDTVLELGCGTGTDAVRLARRGARVVAADASTEMLETAWRKAVAAGVDGCIGFRQLDVDDLGGWDPGLTFDGLLSNFGVLNCTPDWAGVAEAAARWMRPGGRAVLVLMGPLCPWEIAWHLLHGQVRRAVRRFRGGVEAHVGGGGKARVWYPSPRRLRSQFAPSFRHVETVGLGALLPPTYLDHLVDARPRLFERLAAVEGRCRGAFPWTWLNDHYLVVLERGASVDRPPSPDVRDLQ